MLVHKEVTGSIELCLASQNSEGKIVEMEKFLLDGLPKRPKGVTCLEFCLSFSSSNNLELEVRDVGFGELFPKVDFDAKFKAQLSKG